MATTLAPGESTTCTAVHTVSPAEMDAGGDVANTVTVTTAQGASGTDSMSIPITQAPALTIDKTSADTTFAAPGDVLHYSYLVTNSGNVTLTAPFTVADDKATDEACPATPTSLAPGDTITCTATYTVTQADIDAGSVTNVASASGSFTFAGDQTPTVITSPTDTLTIAAAGAPTLTIAKTSTTTTVTTVGQVIPYSYAVANTGNVTISGLALADTNTDAAPVCLVTTLAPGASTTCTAVHTVTQAELDAGGSVSNSVTATTSQGATATDSLDIPVSQSPKLTIAKSITAGDPYDSVGDTITYGYTVTNSGNVTISAIAVSDDTVDAPPVCLADTLAPTAEHDLHRDLHGDPGRPRRGQGHQRRRRDRHPGRWQPRPADRQPDAPQATRTPVLTLDKTITSGDPYTTPGATIGYSYTVTNTGNVTIHAVAVSDDRTDGAPVCLATTLGPGETTTCTAVHTVTQADLDAGSVTNHASAHGTPAGGTLVPPTDQATATATQAPALTIDKTSTDTTFAAPGDVLDYSYLVTNSGNVTLAAPFTVADDKATDEACPATPTSLAPGDTITCTATYTVTQADIDAGSVTNVASASGSFTFAGDQTPTVITSPTDTLTIAAAGAPTLTIAKTSTTTTVTTVGQVIPYSYAVANTGNVTISGLALADTNTDAAPVCLVTTLAPGASTTCTAVHTVTQAELDAGGSVSNSVTATTSQGATATDSLDIPVSQSPKLTIAKSITAGDPYDSVGDTITYGYTVTNSGNVTISAIAVSDDTVDAPPVCLATTPRPD